MGISSFQELRYKQQSIKISEATESAILIIKDIFDTIPAALPFILEPSALLLFANLRAESPYHSIGDALDKNQLDKLDTVLAKHAIYRFTEQLSVESAYPGEEIFSLINSTKLNAIPSQFEFMEEIWVPLNLTIPFHYAYIEWAFVIERLLARQMEDGNLPPEWLKDWWAPHNLRLGMMLGYPGEAISSMLWATVNERNSTNKSNAMTSLVVAIDEQYFGSQVGFEVDETLIDAQSIVSIQDTWKRVINHIYDNVPLAKLMANKEFADSYMQLKLHENGTT